MSQKDGFDEYLDTSAKAANAAGIEHHDPNVRQRQTRFGAVLGAGAGGVGGPGAVALSFFVLLPFAFYYWGLNSAIVQMGLVECVPIPPEAYQNYSRTQQCQGTIFANRLFDAITWFAILFAALRLILRFTGYFIGVGLILIPIFFSDEMVGAIAAGCLCLAVYMVCWAVGVQKFTLPIWLSTLAMFGIFLSLLLWVGEDLDRTGAPPLVMEALVAGTITAAYGAFAAISWVIWRTIKRFRPI